MMKRVVRTSRGFVVFEFTGRSWATVAAHDREGWLTETMPWRMDEPNAAENAVAQVTSLEGDEIQRIVGDTLRQYETRGGEEAAKTRLFGRRRRD